MRMAEEFERCTQCGGGWFKIERRVLVQKGSPTWRPAHVAEQECYICKDCGHQQYLKNELDD